MVCIETKKVSEKLVVPEVNKKTCTGILNI